jgi:hypothetical protein
MTFTHTIAATIVLAITMGAVPQASATLELPERPTGIVRTKEFTPIERLPEIPAPTTISGVRVVADTIENAERVETALDRFEAAGWPLDNLEIRTDAQGGCSGHAGVHFMEDDHHVVEVCADTDWVIYHELGHVWSALYLDDADRRAWVELRGLDAWSDAPYDERGTEHAANIIAFGLSDVFHAPGSNLPNDKESLVEAFTWLFGVIPVHMTRGTVEAVGIDTTPRHQVTRSTKQVPDQMPNTDVEASNRQAPVEYRFPLACGYPRWNSRNGGYGYQDPRDWTHVGVDLYAFEGTPVVAPVHGTVAHSGLGKSAGWNVKIEDRFGNVHVFMHLTAPPVVTEGMRVSAGQEIGEVGRTGKAAGGGPHLHYEIRVGDTTINPMPWLVATGSANVTPAPSTFYTLPAPRYTSCDVRK